MDVTRVLSELRSEREEIEQAILDLEQTDPLSDRTAEAAARLVTAIGRTEKRTEKPGIDSRRAVTGIGNWRRSRRSAGFQSVRHGPAAHGSS